MKKYDVVIIGAGTSGLTARREVLKQTDNYLLVHDGPLGTTCARVGCMPSKVLIQVANDFKQHKKLAKMNLIKGTAGELDRVETMKHVRSLRDRFVRGVVSSMPSWKDHYLEGRATFIDQNTIEVNGEKIQADKFIVATGSRPNIPKPWDQVRDLIIDTDLFFEQEVLPENVLVVGLGVIGLELGQALSRIGVNVTGINRSRALGGLSDPVLQDYVFEKINDEFPIHQGVIEKAEKTSNGKLKVEINGKSYEFDQVLLSAGRRPNLDNIGLDKVGVSLNEKGLPVIDMNTLALEEAPHIFMPGDVNAVRPILHEAADEGRIAGFNSVNTKTRFKRRQPMGVTFCEPNIASVGLSYKQLQNEKRNYVIGMVSYEGQGRAIVKLKEQGQLHVYAEEKTGKILGAEMQAPGGEHMAHLLAWAISLKMTVFEALRMPFYHPVVEEGLRTALRDAAKKIDPEQSELNFSSDPELR